MLSFSIVDVKVKARKVTVKGPKGSITKDLSHINIDIRVINYATSKKKGLHVRLQMWNGGYK
jgi:ribosomal protein L6P/L9E